MAPIKKVEVTIVITAPVVDLNLSGILFQLNKPGTTAVVTEIVPVG